MNEHYDIVIVGAGIVGGSLAALLAQKPECANLSIALVDAAQAAPNKNTASSAEPKQERFDPRVVALSESSRVILEEAQAWSKIQAARACPYYRMHVWDADGTGQISFDASSTQSEALGHICENEVVVASLQSVVTQYPERIELLFNEKLEDIQSCESSHCLKFESGLKLDADLVIGADGAHSKLRALAGIPTKEWDYQHTAIVTTVHTEKPHDFCAWQRFSTRGPLAFLPLSVDGSEQHHCSIVWSVDTDYAEELMQLNDAAFCSELSKALELKLGEVLETDKRFAIPLRQRFAKQYIRQGLAIVGDAAHTIHPLAGQGVNLGLYDIKVLAEEIQRACKRGVAINDMATLRRFERKRQPHNVFTMATMEAFKRGFSSDDLTVRWLRNTGLNFVNRHSLIKSAFSHFAAGNVIDV